MSIQSCHHPIMIVLKYFIIIHFEWALGDGKDNTSIGGNEHEKSDTDLPTSIYKIWKPNIVYPYLIWCQNNAFKNESYTKQSRKQTGLWMVCEI